MSKESVRLMLSQIYGVDIPLQDELAKDDPYRQLSEQLVTQFDACVDYLRLKFPNEKINRLMTYFWHSVGNDETPATLNSAVESLQTITLKKGSKWGCTVMVPEDWLMLVIEDPYTQLDRVVYTASLARDYMRAYVINPPLIIYDKKKVERRAKAYEAEYLKTLLQIEPDFSPNADQQQILNDFPWGIAN